MNESKRYKLYKSGKLWLAAAIATTTVTLVGGGVVAHADDGTGSAATSAATVTNVSTEPAETSAEPASAGSTAAEAATPAAVATPAPAPASASATSTSADSTGNISTTSAADQQNALSAVNAVRAATANAATSASATSALALNDDMNAWAQKRANEMTANAGGVLDASTQYSDAPAWVSADGVTSTDLQQSPDYTEGSAVYGSELSSSMQYWYTSVQTGEFLGYFPGDVTDYTSHAVSNWTDSINYPAYASQFLTMTSPYANVMGFAYSYNATTGYTAVVVEVAYLPDIKSTETKTITRTINYMDKDSGATVAAPKTQTVTYTRTKYTSQVDGSVRYSDWTSTDDTFASVDSPDLSAEGYAPAAAVASLATTADSTDSVVNVTYEHATATTTESKTVTRTVNYLDKSTGAVVSPAKTQTATFTRTSTKDPVTNTTTYTDWTSNDANFAAIASPDLSAVGYQAADTASVSAQTVTADDTDTTINVYYNADVTAVPETQTVTRTINYLDQTTGAVVSPAKTQTVTFTRTANTNRVTGVTTYTDWTSADTTFAAVDAPDLSAAGYTAADPETTVAQTVAAGDSNSTVNVYYNHAIVTVPETQAVTRTINYLDQTTGTVVSPAKTQTVTFTRNGSTDQVTGVTTYTDWTSDDATFAAVASPDLSATGYTAASDAAVATETVAPGDANETVNIYYGHTSTTTTESKTVTQTIKYVDAATGATLSDPDVQTVTFERQVTTDNVTGAQTAGDWTTTGTTAFETVDSPEIDGYTTDTTTVDGQTVTADSQDSTITVAYNTVQPESDNNALPTSASSAATSAEPAAPVTVASTAQPAASQAVSQPTTAQPAKVVVTTIPAKSAAKQQTKSLPQTDNANEAGLAGLGMATLLSMFGLAGVMKRRQTK